MLTLTAYYCLLLLLFIYSVLPSIKVCQKKDYNFCICALHAPTRWNSHRCFFSYSPPHLPRIDQTTRQLIFGMHLDLLCPIDFGLLRQNMDNFKTVCIFDTTVQWRTSMHPKASTIQIYSIFPFDMIKDIDN